MFASILGIAGTTARDLQKPSSFCLCALVLGIEDQVLALFSIRDTHPPQTMALPIALTRTQMPILYYPSLTTRTPLVCTSASWDTLLVDVTALTWCCLVRIGTSIQALLYSPTGHYMTSLPCLRVYRDPTVFLESYFGAKIVVIGFLIFSYGLLVIPDWYDIKDGNSLAAGVGVLCYGFWKFGKTESPVFMLLVLVIYVYVTSLWGIELPVLTAA